jgi:hypothetical protein
MSYNPQSGLVYIPAFNLCMDMVGKQEEYKRGRFYLAAEFDLGRGGPGSHLSEMLAWDVVSGRLKTPPSFLGPIGERIFAASPEGGALFVFELGS